MKPVNPIDPCGPVNPVDPILPRGPTNVTTDPFVITLLVPTSHTLLRRVTITNDPALMKSTD